MLLHQIILSGLFLKGVTEATVTKIKLLVLNLEFKKVSWNLTIIQNFTVILWSDQVTVVTVGGWWRVSGDAWVWRRGHWLASRLAPLSTTKGECVSFCFCCSICSVLSGVSVELIFFISCRRDNKRVMIIWCDKSIVYKPEGNADSYAETVDGTGPFAWHGIIRFVIVIDFTWMILFDLMTMTLNDLITMIT